MMIGQTIDYTFYVRNQRDVRHTENPEDLKRERQKITASTERKDGETNGYC